jgi:hypothetical protein
MNRRLGHDRGRRQARPGYAHNAYDLADPADASMNRIGIVTAGMGAGNRGNRAEKNGRGDD